MSLSEVHENHDSDGSTITDDESDDESIMGHSAEARMPGYYEEQEDELNVKDPRQMLDTVLLLLEKWQKEQDDFAVQTELVVEAIVGKSRLNALLEPSKNVRFKQKPTALHIMAIDAKEKGFPAVSERVRKALIHCLLEHAHTKRSNQGQVLWDTDPILMAAMDYNQFDEEFLQDVCDFSKDLFADMMDDTNKDGQNCLHTIFTPRRGKLSKEDRMRATRRAQLLIPLAKPSTITAKDGQGNTPLHFAFDYRFMKNSEHDYHGIVKQMIERGDHNGMAQAFNNHKESPLSFLRATKTRINNGNEAIKATSSSKKASKEQSRDTTQDKKTETSGKHIKTGMSSDLLQNLMRQSFDSRKRHDKNLGPKHGKSGDRFGRNLNSDEDDFFMPGITKGLTGDAAKKIGSVE
jgi:hypothetical protein